MEDLYICPYHIPLYSKRGEHETTAIKKTTWLLNMTLSTVCFLKGSSFLNLQADLGDARKIRNEKVATLFIEFESFEEFP